MNTIQTAKITLALVSIFTTASFAQNTNQQQRGGHQGPPPEAYTACEGKSAGDSAQFTSPRGDSVTGTCEDKGGKLILRPDNMPSQGQGQR